MDLVIDASVAVKWFVHEADSDRALELLPLPIELFAPSLLLLEVARALQRHATAGVFAPRLVASGLSDLRKSLKRIVPLEDLVDEALRLAQEIRHPIYDCVYLTLAKRTGARMITADVKFSEKIAVTAHARNLVHLADWRQ